MSTVAVIMSTYNGKRFLAEQLESIEKQITTIHKTDGDTEQLKVELYIRDDGSTDGTRQILLDYTESRENVIFINPDDSDNIGVKDSFMSCLEYAYLKNKNIDYFSFSDQDDVWEKDKLISAVEKMKNKSDEKGILYYSNKTFVDENLDFIRDENIVYYGDLMEILWTSLSFGCTQVFSRKMCELVLNAKPDVMDYFHDSWVYHLAKCVGASIVFDKDSHILYRQHGNNVCGMNMSKPHNDVFKYVSQTLLRKVFARREHFKQKLIISLYQKVGPLFTEDANILYDNISSYTHEVKAKIALLRMKGIKKRNLIVRCAWVYKVIFNML